MSEFEGFVLVFPDSTSCDGAKGFSEAVKAETGYEVLKYYKTA